MCMKSCEGMTMIFTSIPTRSGKPGSGFTLAEIAIVVLLMGILMTMGMKMLTVNLDSAASSETKAKQNVVKTALIGYLRTNKHLPCPSQLTGGIPNGNEAVSCTANVQASYGYLPWITLGLSKDAVLDGWKHFFVYKVANGFPALSKNWTSTTSNNPFDINELTTPTNAITIQEGDGATAPANITQKAVVVIFSVGKNGYGAMEIQGPSNVAPPATNISETTNATAANANPTFIIRPYSETALAAAGGPFDDIVTYMTPQDLLQPLVTEQTLSTCKSYCQTNSACTGPGTPYSYCAGIGNPPVPPVQNCTGSGVPYAYCTGVGTPPFPEAACTAAGVPYSFCTGAGTPAMPLNQQCGAIVSNPYSFCAGAANSPPVPVTKCTAAGTPYSFCIGSNNPVPYCLATNVPIGSPVVACAP